MPTANLRGVGNDVAVRGHPDRAQRGGEIREALSRFSWCMSWNYHRTRSHSRDTFARNRTPDVRNTPGRLAWRRARASMRLESYGTAQRLRA